MYRIRLSCPYCGEEIKGGIPLSEKSLKKDTMVVKCTNQECKRDIKLKKHALECIHCKEKCEIFIPEKTQIFGIHYIDTSCEKNCSKKEKMKRKKKLGKFYFLRCEERFHHSRIHPGELLFRCNKCKLLFHAVLIRGRKSVCLLQKNNEDIPASLLHILAGKFSRLFEEITLKIHTIFGGCKPFLIYGRARTLGEIIFPYFLMSLCFIFYILIFMLFNYYQYLPIAYYAFLFTTFASIIYFSLLVLKEMVIVLGEIELKSTEDFIKGGMYDSFFAFKIWPFLGLSFVLILFTDEILEFGLHFPLTEIEKIRWIDNIAFTPGIFIFTSFTIPVFFGFGAFLYTMWNYIYKKYPNKVFRCNFLEIAPLIEKLAEVSIHIVLFFASVLFLNEIFVRQFYIDSPLSKKLYLRPKNDATNFFYHSLSYSAVILPLVLFFLYLGKIVRDLKILEFRRIDEKIKMSHSLKEKEALFIYRAEVSKALRWISGVDYTARFTLLTYLGYILSKVINLT